MVNSNNYITSFKKFGVFYFKNLFNIISVLSGFVTILIPLTKNLQDVNIDMKISYLSLAISFTYPLYLTIKNLLSSLNELSIVKNNLEKDIENINNKFSELKNNRDTILKTYEDYKNDHMPYRGMCNDLCLTIKIMANENPRNNVLQRLSQATDDLENKYFDKGDTDNG